MKKLTGSEERIMECFWNTSKPLSLAELNDILVDMKYKTISEKLITLKKNGYIGVESLDQTAESRRVFRSYGARVSYIEYYMSFIKEDKYFDTVLYVLQKCSKEELKNIQTEINNLLREEL